MSEMVRRVRMALLDKLGGFPVSDGKWVIEGEWDPNELARAAIEAMREPTGEMGAAADLYEGQWELAIDAALKG